MRKSKGFRSWYYFRIGWTTYFAFIFAAINTLTVTYFLAIEKFPALQSIFPSFSHYVIIFTIIVIPLLVTVGYYHYKRTKAFKSEVDVLIENNPYQLRNTVNNQITVSLVLKLNQMVLKLIKNEKMTEGEIKEIEELQNELSNFYSRRTFSSKMDTEFLEKKIRDS